jgi:hypothetical protein
MDAPSQSIVQQLQPTMEIRSVVVHLRIKPSLKAAIEKLAQRGHKTLSHWIELLLQEQVANDADDK